MKVVIVGGGEVGFYFAEWLSSERKEVVVIDKDENALRHMMNHLDVQTLCGSGSSPRILEDAGIEKADIILAVTDNDEVNLVACIFANLLAPNIQKVALIRNDDYGAYQEKLARDMVDISLVINPEVEVVNSILRIISVPEVDQIHDFVDGRIRLVGMLLPAASPLSGISLMQLPKIVERNRMVVAAIVREDRLIIPRGKDTLQADDFVYFACQDSELSKVLELFGRKGNPVKNIMIVGGGKIGYRLAQQLDGKKFNVKLIEMDAERCQTLAGNLHRTMVLNGHATDQAFMEQENAGSMDIVVAVTWDEEVNILASLLAKRLGAKKTVARVNKFAYIPLVHAIGVDHIVSPRRAAIDSIMPSMRRGKIMSTVFIKGKEAEVLEAVALPNSEMVGPPLKDIKLPKEALVLCVARGDEVLIPSGETVIQPQDRLIILSTRKNLARVEQLLVSKRRFI